MHGAGQTSTVISNGMARNSDEKIIIDLIYEKAGIFYIIIKQVRLIMKKVYRIASLSTVVYEDDYKEGELEHVNSWYGRDVLGTAMFKDFESIADILKLLNDKYLYIYKGADNIKNWAIFEDPDLKDEIRFDCDTMVDVDNNVADESDLEEWKKGEKKLYNAHSVLYVNAEYVEYASASELTEEAKKLGLETI